LNDLPVGVSREEANIMSAGRRLVGDWFVPDALPARSAGLLFVHGLWSSRRGYAARAQRVAPAVAAVSLTFDLSGHGDSEGNLDTLTPHAHIDDVIAALDVLRRHSLVDSARIGVSGASYGAYLSTLVASDHGVKRLLLRAPALYDDSILDVPFANWRQSQAAGSMDGFNARASRFAGDVLVLESGSDEVVSHCTIAAYLSAFPEVHHEVIPGATHSLANSVWDDAFVEHLISWFSKL
jgi:hypothetical protein